MHTLAPYWKLVCVLALMYPLDPCSEMTSIMALIQTLLSFSTILGVFISLNVLSIEYCAYRLVMVLQVRI